MVQEVADPDACEQCWAGRHGDCLKVSPRDPKLECCCEVCASSGEDEERQDELDEMDDDELTEA
jgi:hypothetical protein